MNKKEKETFVFYGAQKYKELFEKKFGEHVIEFNTYSNYENFDRFEAITVSNKEYNGYILVDENGKISDLVTDETIEKMREELEQRKREYKNKNISKRIQGK